jgi:hypothetical protein
MKNFHLEEDLSLFLFLPKVSLSLFLITVNPLEVISVIFSVPERAISNDLHIITIFNSIVSLIPLIADSASIN